MEKHGAVSCRWIRSRNRSQLLWVVGNRDKFNEEGLVPVNTTRKNILHNEWEGGWPYLSLLKAVVAVAAFFMIGENHPITSRKNCGHHRWKKTHIAMSGSIVNCWRL